jgi:hypothetical protein
MNLSKLLDISSAPLLSTSAEDVRGASSDIGAELLELLRQKNGFYVFESALHVLPSATSGSVVGLDSWNSPEKWFDYYEFLRGDDARNAYLFFAEDAFANQFAISDDAIYSFETETGEFERMAGSLEDWASVILGDYRYWTGYPLAQEWQQIHGPLPMNKRLAPKQPFILGGEYKVENLYLCDPIPTLQFRGHLATQIHDLPDGATIDLKIVR